MLDQITPLILTLNEEANIARTLERLEWAEEIVIVDSGSSDGTRALAMQFKNVRWVEHGFESHGAQWNFGLAETGIRTDWVLALDADYVLSKELVEEIQTLSPSARTSGYLIAFRYCVFGKVLRGTLYPPVVALLRRKVACFVQDGHTQRLRASGQIGELRSIILHDDRKPLGRWLESQNRYARLEADLLCAKSWREVGWPDRLRKLLVVMPVLAFVYCLTVGRGIFDGWPGLYYALQRALAEAILSMVLIERKVMAAMSGDRAPS